MYDEILVPTDGSDAAESAAESALVLARQFDASIHAIHVLKRGNLPADVESEAAAYIAQVLYLYHLKGEGVEGALTGVITPLAWNIAVPGAQKKGQVILPEDCTALFDAIRRNPNYSHRLRKQEGYDGV